ncbi:putative Dentin sialophosphoprotein [Quillaja saponaria]|uniref:Dentin sialophosphoprotein n=1 Tax=Quillaja saponaria TaxID=32244 RepID=A0AAD7L071_QUISA|nr:putative Dentin sialophosphoprotein [Quillaja saponaria]
MAFEIPLDQIKELRILLRREAKLSWYEPEKVDSTSLPKLPSVEEAIAELDPSPPYLRCKNCKGRLLRGIQSLVCVFCGTHPNKDVPPEPIHFKNTVGYRWLLDSLQLDGSEIVGPLVDANESNRAKITSKDGYPLSELLDLEIRWPSVLEKPETHVLNKNPIRTKNSPNLVGVNLDEFFTKKESPSDAFEQHLAPDKQVNTSNAPQVGENLSLFDNNLPSETTTWSTKDEGGDSSSDWAANFQPRDPGTIQEGDKPFDPFVGSTVDLSAHMDTVFGSGKDSADVKVKDNMNPSESADSDWFQGDTWSNSNSEVSGQTGKSEMNTSLSDGRIADNATDSSSKNIDWIQEEQRQSNNDNATDNRTADDKVDFFDAWNDFTNSASTQDPSNNNLKQSVSPVPPSASQTTEVNLFSSSNNPNDMNFGSSANPDFFSGSLNSPIGSTGDNTIELEASVSNREADAVAKEGKAEDVKGGDVSGTKSGSNADDVEMLMSQMHDISFMLESNLSVPPKLNLGIAL